MSTTTIVIIAVVAVVLVGAIALAVPALRRRKERRDLRERFGSEYERLEDRRGADDAVDELRRREERHERFDIRGLNPERREHFQHQWRETQKVFVDDPAAAVRRADSLIQDVMRERGYPVEDFEQRAADLSVDHPEVVQHYRKGHELAHRSERGETSTEELREGFIHHRRLFERLVGAEPGSDPDARPNDENETQTQER